MQKPEFRNQPQAGANRRLTDGQRYALITAVYAAAMIPSYFLLHPYMVIGIPLLTLGLTMYLLRHEYAALSLQQLRGRRLGSQAQIGIVIALLAQIAFHVLLPNESTVNSVPYQLMQIYPIVPVYMVLQAPIVEEVVFRKIVFGQLRGKLSAPGAALLSSALFGALHRDWIGFALYFAIGLLFCWLYARSRSIVPSLCAHMALNLIFLLNISLF
ncbi:CPBP family intramembrane metalloprotease [Paenibacillus athensensis]|uniref:CAAX prenyl protease 2/Lysostaphin resistance protein A-like domain-containing protein n=1 Tax=Paenibacillus athensensis TaxID=1967502 RepID=A0A4Y8Q9I8_9BACL|nr:type II CAAX endopeptidase family protein [Paenibacillus athensensis]MCD1259067.1 CPBP family intramembrane metalloprotease [Paenibacillus athensensis]